ncbi:hypothetical protein K438DRAFT_2029700 [Mycena galopus ATCC 62051]|nr:hypothetical protein K438DRAFT_2029700 [Mycena galopus ATCC 62051]
MFYTLPFHSCSWAFPPGIPSINIVGISFSMCCAILAAPTVSDGPSVIPVSMISVSALYRVEFGVLHFPYAVLLSEMLATVSSFFRRSEGFVAAPRSVAVSRLTTLRPGVQCAVPPRFTFSLLARRVRCP